MVAALALASRLVLAAVFAVAGVTKLVDRPGSRRAAAEFGAPEWSAGTVALVLPAVELVTAALLLPAATATVGAAVALGLLALLSVVVAFNLARGRRPECHCFGQLHSSPAGWRTLARNGVLAALAAFALGAGLAGEKTSAVAWIGGLEGSGLVALAVCLMAAILLCLGAVGFFSLLRSYGRVLVRLDLVERQLAEAGFELEREGSDPMPEIGLEPGSPVPAFAEIEELLTPGLPVLLLFTSPSCGPCKSLLPQVAAWQREHAASLTVAFASDGAAEDVRAEAEDHGLQHVLVDADLRLYEAFEASGTPSAVLIAPDGTIGSWVAPGRDWIGDLLSRALPPAAEEPGLQVGTEAPPLELPSLEGEPVTLTDLRGRDTLLLFWNPGCGFCRAMHPDVISWERTINGQGPRLVVVSSGDAESTREEGFASTVLLDGSFSAGDAFGAGGTPMAVLVGADGRVASPVVAGADDVLALARNHD